MDMLKGYTFGILLRKTNLSQEGKNLKVVHTTGDYKKSNDMYVTAIAKPSYVINRAG